MRFRSLQQKVGDYKVAIHCTVIDPAMTYLSVWILLSWKNVAKIVFAMTYFLVWILLFVSAWNSVYREGVTVELKYGFLFRTNNDYSKFAIIWGWPRSVTEGAFIFWFNLISKIYSVFTVAFDAGKVFGSGRGRGYSIFSEGGIIFQNQFFWFLIKRNFTKNSSIIVWV